MSKYTLNYEKRSQRLHQKDQEEAWKQDPHVVHVGKLLHGYLNNTNQAHSIQYLKRFLNFLSLEFLFVCFETGSHVA